MLGQNLPQNFPVIDRFEHGVATSIKSVDLTAKTYQNPQNLLRTAERFVDKVRDFQGTTHAGAVVDSGKISGRGLDLAIPKGATAQQRAVLDQVVKYGQQNGVTVKIIEVH